MLFHYIHADTFDQELDADLGVKILVIVGAGE